MAGATGLDGEAATVLPWWAVRVGQCGHGHEHRDQQKDKAPIEHSTHRCTPVSSSWPSTFQRCFKHRRSAATQDSLMALFNSVIIFLPSPNSIMVLSM